MKKLRVALETQYAWGTPTGLGVYASKLADALKGRGDVEVVEIGDAGYDVWRFDRRVYWDQLRAPLLARRARPDVVHFTGGTLPLWTPHPCVLTLHDIAWVDGAVAARRHMRLYFGSMQRRLTKRADRVATDTEASRAHIITALELPPSKVAVTGAAVDGTWFALERVPTDSPYLLSVGTVEKRKDLVTAVRALAQLPGYRLVSVGPATPYAADVRKAAAASGVAGRLEMRGFVDDETLRALYASASALVFPSLYEGFGLPPLQALAARLPVVASDIPVLREVLSDYALFAQPGDPTSFAERIQEATSGDIQIRELVERGRLHARRFSWPGVAERTMSLYRALT